MGICCRTGWAWVGGALAATVVACATLGGASDQTEQSQAAFAEVARVLRHPRCLNCHPSSDVPGVGDDRRPHGMNVRRGPDNHGVAAMPCSSCHQPVNQDLLGVPGAPNWHLAPRSMGWEGLDDQALAEALLDPQRNGNRSPAELLLHMEQDPLVVWAWKPGRGRGAPPVSHAAFVQSLKTWLDTGAAVPRPGTTSTFEDTP